MKEQTLYISYPQETYRHGKANLLSSEIDLLKILKTISSIKRVREEKEKLRDKIQHLSKSITLTLDKLETKLPEVPKTKFIKDLTTSMEKETNKNSVKITLTKKQDEYNSLPTIDQELIDIQKKLKQLS